MSEEIKNTNEDQRTEAEKRLFEMVMAEEINAEAVRRIKGDEQQQVSNVASILSTAQTPEAAKVIKMAIDQDLAAQKEAFFKQQEEASKQPMELVGEEEIEDIDLTPEDKAVIEEMLADNTGDPEDDALMEQAKKEAAEHAGEKGYDASATVEITPEGRSKIVSIDDENTGFSPITETFDEYLERHMNDESLDDLPIDEKTAAEVIMRDHNDISFEDAEKLASVLCRWKAKEISSIQAFNEFPTFISSSFNAQLMGANIPFTEQAKHKKEFAKSVLDSIASSTQMQQATDDVNAQIEKVYADYGDNINVLYQAAIFEKINAMKNKLAAIEKDQQSFEDPEKQKKWEEAKEKKKDQVNKIIDALNESYKFEKFAKRIGHIKAKSIDLTDPIRCFSRFNSKYAHSKFHIPDISATIPILEKHCGFTHEQALEFIVVFCEYCKNMRPNNIHEHVFMHYTIANINGLAITAGDKAEKFANGLVGNLKALMAIHESKGNGEDYVALGLTDEEIDEILKTSTALIKEAEESAKDVSDDEEEEISDEVATTGQFTASETIE